MYRILMIDDEPWLLLARKAFLEGKGCRVETAQTPEEAAAHLARGAYDLILLDVKMPDVSGFDLCGAIKKRTGAPVVFLSSLTEEEDQLRGFSAGGADYKSPRHLLIGGAETCLRPERTLAAHISYRREAHKHSPSAADHFDLLPAQPSWRSAPHLKMVLLSDPLPPAKRLLAAATSPILAQPPLGIPAANIKRQLSFFFSPRYLQPEWSIVSIS